MSRWSTAIRAEDRSRLVLPLLVAALLFGAYAVFGTKLTFPGGLYHLFGTELTFDRVNFGRYVEFLAALAFVFFIVRLIDIVVFDLVMSRRRNVIAPQLLRQILGLVLYFLLFAWALNEILDRDIRPALAGGAVIAAILGLALQDTLGNLFSGMALHLEGGFEVGDVLHSGEFVGTVENVSWRATRMRGFNNQIIVLPNSVIARERLEVFHHNNLNARVLQLGVDYNIPPATVIGIVSQAAAHVDGVSREMPCFARVATFADSSVIYEIKYHTRRYEQRERIDADIRKAVWYALHRNKIAFATPVRAYQMYTAPDVQQAISAGDVRARLSEVDVLSPLSDEARATIAAATRIHFYSNGETILPH